MRQKYNYLVVIPYVAGEAQGRELAVAVRGWVAHFKEDFRLWIVGDKPVNIESYGGIVEHIPMQRSSSHVGHPALDIVAKMRHVIELAHAEGYRSFIWSNDDIYAVNDFTAKDVMVPKHLGIGLKGDPGSGNHFRRSMWRTRQALLAAGKPAVNYCNHLPNCYNFIRLTEVLDKFGCDTNEHLINSLYFNYIPERVRTCNLAVPGRYKKGFYVAGEMTVATVREAIDTGKIWINNSNVGYNMWAVNFIDEYNKAILENKK